MAGSYLDRFSTPVVDINNSLDSIAIDLAVKIDRDVTELYGSLHSIRHATNSFSFGFIPPDIRVNFVSTEQVRRSLAVIPGNPNAKIAANNGRRKVAKSGPNELKRRNTEFTNLELGSSMYRKLKADGYSDEEASRIVPLMVGHMEAELGGPGSSNGSNRPGSSYKTENYNIGNVIAGTKGEFKNSNRGNDPNNWGIGPTPPSGGTYILSSDNGQPTYKVASTSLEEAASKQVDINLQWKGTDTASNSQEYASSLVPSPENPPPGGNSSPYFTQDTVSEYARKIEVGAERYRTDLSASGKTIGDFVPPEQERDGVLYTGVRIMGSGETAAQENDDPLASTGRNLREVQGQRQIIAQKQVKYIQSQIDAISSTPPLLWLIPPQEFKRKYEQPSDTPKGRRGHIVHTWLQKPTIIDVKGKTSVQYVFDIQGRGGITHENRIHSLSYRNLMSLLRMYKNNAQIYSGQGAFGEDNDGVALYSLSMWLHHDGRLYIGSFNSFDITDSASSPHNLEYSFQFEVYYEVEVSSPPSSSAPVSSGGA